MKYVGNTRYSHVNLIENESLACVEFSLKASNGIRWLRWTGIIHAVTKVIQFSNNGDLVSNREERGVWERHWCEIRESYS